MEYIVQLIAQFLAVMLVICFHEFSHAYAAYKCGDPTAKFMGRMTMNPAKHFDPLGIIMFTVVGFGWAKPVPINPNNFRNYKKGSLWTASAGVIANYLMAFAVYPILALVWLYLLPVVKGTYAFYFLGSLFGGIVVYSLSFCVFNLLPVFPLDGFRIIEATVPHYNKFYLFLRRYGYYILLGLLLVHLLNVNTRLTVIDPLGYVLSFAREILSKPITIYWNGIFELFGVTVPPIL